MAAFDPVSAAVGGALIGLAVTLLMLLIGRIAGISGIFGDLVAVEAKSRGWQLAFVPAPRRVVPQAVPETGRLWRLHGGTKLPLSW